MDDFGTGFVLGVILSAFLCIILASSVVPNWQNDCDRYGAHYVDEKTTYQCSVKPKE